MEPGDVVKVGEQRPRRRELVRRTRERASEGKRTVWIGRQKPIDAARRELDADPAVERFGPFHTDDGQGWVIEWRPSGTPASAIAFWPRARASDVDAVEEKTLDEMLEPFRRARQSRRG